MNLHAKPVVEMLKLAYPLVKERGHSLFVGMLGDERTECQQARRKEGGKRAKVMLSKLWGT